MKRLSRKKVAVFLAGAAAGALVALALTLVLRARHAPRHPGATRARPSSAKAPEGAVRSFSEGGRPEERAQGGTTATEGTADSAGDTSAEAQERLSKICPPYRRGGPPTLRDLERHREALLKFIEDFPDSTAAGEARELLAELEAEIGRRRAGDEYRRRDEEKAEAGAESDH